MNVHGFLVTTAVTAALSTPAFAASITDGFTSFWVLGDSLSGYVGEPGGETTLRASDGPLWSEQIVLDFQDAGKEAESFAIGGATAGLTRPIDLATQVDRLEEETDRFGDTPLVGITIGGNDIGAFASGLPTDVSRDAFDTAITDLITAGVSDFLIFNVPDVGSTPLVRDFTPYETEEQRAAAIQAATEASMFLNFLFFNDALSGIQVENDINVTIIDAFTLTQFAYGEPDFFGVDAAGPCNVPVPVIPENPEDEVTFVLTNILDCTTTTLWDPFHPTSVVHNYIANEIRDIYAPVPLPAAGWMLLAGIGGLVAMRRRKS